MLLAAGALLGGCSQETAVALTITADASLDDATLSALRRLDLRVTGAEGACRSYPLPNGFSRSREERLVFRPRARSGELTLDVTVRDGVEGAKGYGTVRVTLESGRIQFARVAVRSPVPAGADGPCVEQPPGDGGLPDLSAPPDMVCDDNNPCTVDEVVQGQNGSTCRFTPGNRGTVCRAAAGACDVAETCDGANAQCPADGRMAAGTECRATSGGCDLPETCDGTSTACPADIFTASGVVCRASAGGCDVAESCTGTSADCPADAFAPSSRVCRGAVPGGCDVAENCTGTSPNCPADVVAPSSTVCRGAAPGGCDVAENCTGTSPTCPVDVFAPSNTVCRGAAPGGCDVAENCTGTSPTCPVDVFRPSGSLCRAASGSCDVPENCTGSSPNCPGDVVVPAGTICHPSTGACDPAETCTGSSPACPSDRLASPGTLCRPPAYACDATETCTGGSPSCPGDLPIPNCEVLVNGDFESGTANWGLTGDAYLASAPSCVPQSGSNYVFLCGLNSTSGSVYQDFSIAPGTNPRLTFWLHIYSDEGTASPFDYLYVEVLDTNSPLQQTLATYTNVAKTSVYVQQGTFSLGGFAGRTVRLRFRATTDGSNITTFRIDNVSVQY